MKAMLIENAQVDPRYVAAEQELGALLSAYMGAPVTHHVVKEIQALVNEYRMVQAAHGVKLPKMRVVALPQSGYIQIWPEDLTEADFNMRVKMLIKLLKSEGRNYDPHELSKAIMRAYPAYRPSRSNLIN